jgi:hypothetical protein
MKKVSHVEKELRMLAGFSDDEIDFSDILEVRDRSGGWRGAS